jgi:hypothetical protein
MTRDGCKRLLLAGKASNAEEQDNPHVLFHGRRNMVYIFRPHIYTVHDHGGYAQLHTQFMITVAMVDSCQVL